MLGEIIKSSEALRYHAKTAEVAGQNLAHVNDENYARQRVLAREGRMFQGQGGLNTSALEGKGLEHSRNELLDKRVFSEFAESANLETQKEILSLIQAALGESIDRQSLGGSLSQDIESNLSAGGLARAFDDLFNAFQELSASPDEATAKEEIVNKIKTLTKRFNDAGQAIDEIDSDLSASMDSAVNQVNKLLGQINDLNKQIKRFELLDQGKAVTYRDNRQGILEELSKLLDFKISPEIDPASNNETGFWNIFVTDESGNRIDLVNAETGVLELSKEFGNIKTLQNEAGKDAQVRAKITADGTLGHIEVIDGGSLYDDEEGPILFAITPPLSKEENNNLVTANLSHRSGEVFSQGNKLYQALTETIAGADLSDKNLFIEISQIPESGKVFPESLRKYSDLESFNIGDQIFYEGKLYQALDSVGVKSNLNLDATDSLLRNLSKGEVVELDNLFFQIAENKTKGNQIDRLKLSEAKVGEEVNGFIALGDTPPKSVEDISFVPSVIDTSRPDRWFLTKSYQKGDIVKYQENFFQFTQDTFRGVELDDFARAMQSLTYDQTKNYQAGDFVKLDGSYYQFTGDVPAFSDVETVALSLSAVYGSETQQFDGVLQAVEDPNWHFIESQGSFKIADAFREYEITDLSGSEQTKQVRLSNISGDASDTFNFNISIDGKIVNFDDETDLEKSFSLSGFDNISFAENLKNKLLEISSNGNAVSGSPSKDPAFDVLVDQVTGDLLISGVAGLGEFEISVSTENLTPQDSEDIEPSIVPTVERNYIADQFNFLFSSESFEDVTVNIPFKGNSAKTSESIVQAIADNEVLSQFITASTTNGQVYFRAKEQDFDFSVKLADTNGIEDLHNDLTNQTKVSTAIQSEPKAELIKEAFEGVPVSTTLNNFSGLEVVQKSEIIFPGAYGEAASEFDNYGAAISFNLDLAGNNTIIEIPESPGRTLEELITQTEEVLLSIESDGTFQQGVQAVDPAFSFVNRFGEEKGVVTTWRNDRAGEIWVSGVPGLGNFNLTPITENTSVRVLQDYSQDEYNLFIEGKNGDLGSISVPFQGNEVDTVEAIKEAINNDEVLNKEVTAVAQGTELIVTGLTPEADFSNIRWDIEGELAPQTVAFNGVTQPSSKQTFEIGNLEGIEQVQKSSIQFVAGPGSEDSNPFTISINGVEISLELPEGNGDPLDLSRFESLETELNSINKDGTKTLDGSASNDPAFDVTFLNESQTFLLSGNKNLGDFIIDVNAAASLESDTLQEFISDELNIEIQDENGQIVGTVKVPSKSDASQNANEIVNEINSDANILGLLTASISSDGDKVVLEGLDTETKFSVNVSVTDNFNEFTATEISQLNQAERANLLTSGPSIARVEKTQVDSVGIVSSKVQSIDFKLNEEPMVFGQNEIYYFNNEDGGFTHFLVTAPTPEIDPAEFNPLDEEWSEYFRIIKPQLMNDDDPSIILRKAFPSGYDLENGTMVELNIGLAEAVVNKGEITGFNILNAGNGLPNADSLFVDGKEISVEAGKIKGLQDSRSIHLEKFRNDLNDLVVSFVEATNEIYNPDDEPGAYLFGFDAVLTRPISGRNLLMEEEYGYFGREGDASITLFRDEVEMTLPHAASESFSIVNTTPIFPEEFSEDAFYFRGGDDAEILFRSDNANELFSFYASASKMQNVNMENEDSYPGADSILGTDDDGRSLMMAYEPIPFRIEGLEEDAKLPIIGDNFTFSALLSNPWNLATSLKVDKRLSTDTLKSSNDNDTGSNDIALSIAELGDQNYIEKVSLLNADMGIKIADLNDNLDHQKSIETLLLDQRRAVSSVSIDEEVADLMRFQRSFQASSRVLSTLDKMLEIVVMGLVR